MTSRSDIEQQVSKLDARFWLDSRMAFNGIETLVHQLAAKAEVLEDALRAAQTDLDLIAGNTEENPTWRIAHTASIRIQKVLDGQG